MTRAQKSAHERLLESLPKRTHINKRDLVVTRIHRPTRLKSAKQK